jgi:WD40 repeat protein
MGTNGKLLKLSFEILILPFCERLSSTSMFELNRGFGYILRRRGRLDPTCPPMKRIYKCFIGSWDGAVNVIDLETGNVTCIVKNLDGPVYGIRVDLSNDKKYPNGKLFTCEGTGRIHIWDISKLLFPMPI